MLQWDDAVTAALQHPTSWNLLGWMRRQCEAGRAQLWRMRDARDCLYVITRLDYEPTQWVVCYVRGTGLLRFGPYFIEVARQKGWPLRMHTESLSTARLCRRLGFVLCEYVLRCDHVSRRQG